MPTCDHCQTEALVPIELNCNHNYCFLCLFYNYDTDSNCPTCHEDGDLFEMNKIINTDTNKYYIWLYSSNYGNTWWCYQKQICEKVEKIYKDYCLRKQILNSVPVITPISLSVSKKSNKSKKSAQNLNKDAFDELDADSNSDVEFSDDDSENTDNNQNDQGNQVSQEIMSYVVTIHGSEYKLDFDSMKQINLNDTSKKRNVKRIEVLHHIRNKPMTNIIDYMKNNEFVLGVSGKKF